MSVFEFNVPLPIKVKRVTSGGDKHQLRDFPVGASRFIPKFGATDDKTFSSNMASVTRSKNKGAKIIHEVRTEDGVLGARLWRTA